jgi:hypothetical protein
MLVLDGWGGVHSGLNLVAGQTGDDNATTYRGRVLRPGMRNRVNIDVRRNQVDVLVNEQPIISWSGNPTDLTIDSRFWPAWKGKLYVGSWNTAFRVSRLELSSQSGKPPAVAPTSKVTQFEGFSFEVPPGWTIVVPDRRQTKAMLLLGGMTWNTSQAMLKVDVGKPAATNLTELAQKMAENMKGHVMQPSVDFDGTAGVVIHGSNNSLAEAREAVVLLRDGQLYVLMGGATTDEVDFPSLFERIRKSWKWTE